MQYYEQLRRLERSDRKQMTTQETFFPFSGSARRPNTCASIVACMITIVVLSRTKVDPIDRVVKEELDNPFFPSGIYRPIALPSAAPSQRSRRRGLRLGLVQLSDP
jgi:hypothetical protein